MAAETPFRLVSFDIDGTLTLGHGWKFLADQTGRNADYERLHARFADGRAGEDEHLREMLGFAEGLQVDRLARILEETPKVHGIAETTRELKEAETIPVLLTHNPPLIAGWYARRFGFAATDGTLNAPRPATRDGRVLPSGPIRTDKIGGLQRLLARFGVAPSEAAHVGDSRPDAQLFPLVAYGLAVNPSSPAVAAAADQSVRIDDLREVLPLLENARRRLPKAAIPPAAP